MTDIENKKQALSKYKGYELELKSLHLKIRELESKISSIKAQQMSDMPPAPFTAKGGNEAINDLVDLKAYYESLHKKTINECKKIELMINGLDDPMQRTALRCLYLNNLNWDQTMDKLRCSKTSLHNLLIEALNKIKL